MYSGPRDTVVCLTNWPAHIAILAIYATIVSGSVLANESSGFGFACEGCTPHQIRQCAQSSAQGLADGSILWLVNLSGSDIRKYRVLSRHGTPFAAEEALSSNELHATVAAANVANGLLFPAGWSNSSLPSCSSVMTLAQNQDGPGLDVGALMTWLLEKAYAHSDLMGAAPFFRTVQLPPQPFGSIYDLSCSEAQSAAVGAQIEQAHPVASYMGAAVNWFSWVIPNLFNEDLFSFYVVFADQSEGQWRFDGLRNGWRADWGTAIDVFGNKVPCNSSEPDGQTYHFQGPFDDAYARMRQRLSEIGWDPGGWVAAQPNCRRAQTCVRDPEEAVCLTQLLCNPWSIAGPSAFWRSNRLPSGGA